MTAELIADVATLALPVEAGEIAEALRRLRLWPLLDGHRGAARADVDAVIDAALRLQAMMLANPRLIEIEINPLMAQPKGAVAVDALIREEPE